MYWIYALPLAFSLTLSVLMFSYPLLIIIIAVNQGEGLKNRQSPYLRHGMIPPVGIIDSTNQSIRMVNSTHLLPSICERNNSYVRTSNELAFMFWNTSYSRQSKRRSEVRYSNLDIDALCSYYASCADSAMWATPEHKAYLIGKMDPVMYKLAELDRNVSGTLNIKDWYYNGDLLATSLIRDDQEIEYCERKMFQESYKKLP